MPSKQSNNLVTEAGDLIERLNARLGDCFIEHPYLGEVPRPGTPPLIRRLKQARYKAQRRLNRRKAAAGIPISVAGAMWIINQADSGYF